MPVEILYYLFSLIVVLQLAILFFLWSRRDAVYHRDVLLDQGKARTSSIIHRAIQQANKVLITAELKGIQLISRQKLTGSELTHQFNQHLAAVEKALQDQFIRNAEHADQSYAEFLANSEKIIKEHIAANEKMLTEKSVGMVTQTESMLAAFTHDMEEKVKGDIDLQMKKVVDEIQHYKLTRMRVIDERIVDVLEEVLKVVLEKKLTIVDQSDLVYKALEQAKKDHAFVEMKKS